LPAARRGGQANPEPKHPEGEQVPDGTRVQYGACFWYTFLMKVLIVGAGPTGLTAALEFARQGVIPEIVDAKASPSGLSRAIGILPESIEKLKVSGAGNRILKEGISFKRLSIRYNNKVLVDFDFRAAMESKDRPVSLPQDRTEAIMRDVLKEKGTQVQYNCKVVDVKTDCSGASVTFEGGESKKYDWVIGADGVNSTVREKLGIEFKGYDLPEVWSIADVELGEEYDEGAFVGWLIDGVEKDILIIAPIGPKRVRVVSSTPDSIATLPIKLDIKKIRRVGTFKISIRQAETYLKGRVLLAGDSAHSHSPVGGRGMNLGIDDAVEAVKSILEGKTHDYNIERRELGARIIRGTEKARKMLVSSNPFAKMFIGSIFFLIRHLKPLRKIFLRNLARL